MLIKFVFYKDYTPLQMLKSISDKKFLEIQYDNIRYLTQGKDVDIISISIEDSSGSYIEYDRIEITPTNDPKIIMDKIIEYAEANIVEIMTLKKLR
jgi:hypothetical protein